GFAVELIATTATEGYATLDPTEWASPDAVCPDGIHRFESRGVRCAVLDEEGDAYDVLFDDTLRRFRPDLVFTYGGSPRAVARRRRARAAGARVIFGLYNTAYPSRAWFDHVDLVITPSEFLSRYYRDAIGLDSEPLPTPLWPDDVLADRRAPARVTMVNPSLEKGALVFAAIAAMLGERYPDIEIEVFPSRSSPSSLMQIAALAGI